MTTTTLLWYTLAGFLLGWISSSLVEWLWFRGRRYRLDLESVSAAQPPPGADDLSTQEVLRQVEEATIQRARAQPMGGPPANRPDPLSAIRGIGEVYEQRLYRAGVFTWHQLSRMEPETLRRITKALPSSNPASWIEQARELAMEHRRVGAIYEGPIPDDLTRIDGIDQVYEERLYEAGIVTYAQLGERAPDELQQIIPAHLAGEEIDFARWIAQANALQAEAAAGSTREA